MITKGLCNDYKICAGNAIDLRGFERQSWKTPAFFKYNIARPPGEHRVHLPDNVGRVSYPARWLAADRKSALQKVGIPVGQVSYPARWPRRTGGG